MTKIKTSYVQKDIYELFLANNNNCPLVILKIKLRKAYFTIKQAENSAKNLYLLIEPYH